MEFKLPTSEIRNKQVFILSEVMLPIHLCVDTINPPSKLLYLLNGI